MQKRFVLWWMLLFQLICNTFVTLSMDIAIVSMVGYPDTRNHDSEASNIICSNSTSSFLIPQTERQREFKSDGLQWTVAEQNMILSGYYWLNYLSILPGGVLAHKYGSKRVAGFSQTVSSLMSSLIPFVSIYGAACVAWVRALQGLLSFVSVPASLFTIIGNWSPPQERGKFGSTILAGSSFGLSVGSLCFGYIGEYVHWKYIFHITSLCGLVWGALWWKLIYDTPEEHPKISIKEREYIGSSLQATTAYSKTSIPWKNMFSSVPVMVSVACANSATWIFVLVTTYTPIYLKTLYGLHSNEIGTLTSIPQLLAGMLSLFLGHICDHIVKRGILNITQTRKLFTFIGSVIAALPLVVIAFTHCNLTLVIVSILLCMLLKTSANFGVGLVIIDMSPKFCGVLQGLSGTTSSILTFVFSAAISYFTTFWGAELLWKVVFLFSSVFSILSAIAFILYGSSEVRKWNYTNVSGTDNVGESSEEFLEESTDEFLDQSRL